MAKPVHVSTRDVIVYCINDT